MITIKTGQLKAAVELSKQLPEFEDPYTIDEYATRLKENSLVLTAYIDDKPVGFKIGYDRFKDGSFYSWMGGILPEFRKQGVADKLADHQEKWARERGYQTIRLKTRKKHKAMLEFSSKREFVITEKIPKIPKAETLIWMEKKL